MQTFFPYPDIVKSVKCLDLIRLGKQRIEAWQLLSANGDSQALELRRIRTGKTDIPKGWVNHPAAKMWRGYNDALRAYYNAAVDSFTTRGGINKMPLMHIPDEYPVPEWFTNTELHKTHRSRLLFKGSLDLLKVRIKLRTKDPVNKWLKQWSLPDINLFREPHRRRAHIILDTLGVIPVLDGNYYDRYNWDVPWCMEYIWPS